MLREELKKYKIVLASQSPRRKQLLEELGLDFTIQPLHIDESYPTSLKHVGIAKYLAELKASAFDFGPEDQKTLVITSDTIVWLDGEVLSKPPDRNEAISILKKLSGRQHEVISGVCLKTIDRQKSFTSITKVKFRKLTMEEIEYYVDNFKPYDKAGAYGIQEWIGFVGIESIEGSYFNVVGLPVQKLYVELMTFEQGCQ